MRIEIVTTDMGFIVRLSAADRRDFARLLAIFKKCIPDNCRRFSDGKWHVEQRAARSLETFIAMVEDAGAKVAQATQPRKVKTMEQMVRGARRAA
jgi:hypothetical protein